MKAGEEREVKVGEKGRWRVEWLKSEGYMRVEEIDVTGKVTRTIDFGLFYYEDSSKTRSIKLRNRNGLYTLKIYSKKPTPLIFDTAKLIVLNSSFTVSLSAKLLGGPEVSFHLSYSTIDTASPYRLHFSMSPMNMSNNIDFVMRTRFIDSIIDR